MVLLKTLRCISWQREKKSWRWWAFSFDDLCCA